MNLEDPIEEQRRFRVEFLALFVLVLLAAGALVTVLIVRGQDDGDAVTVTQTATSTAAAAATATAIVGAHLAGPTDLRSGPGGEVAILERLAANAEIRIVGRSPDGAWLAVALVQRPEVVGWLEATAVVGVDTTALPVVAPPGGHLPADPNAPTFAPDLPDLVVSAVYAQDNELHVEVLNQGRGDSLGEYRISISGSAPIDLEAKGVPLRPGEAFAARVPGEYVQLRSLLEVTLLPKDGRQEQNPDNNAWEGVIEPDLPNDLEVSGAHVDEDEGYLLVTVTNRSPIPITGIITITVREALPSTALLGRHTEFRTIERGASMDLTFPEITEPDLTRITISISTPAIDDANLANNTYPR